MCIDAITRLRGADVQSDRFGARSIVETYKRSAALRELTHDPYRSALH